MSPAFALVRRALPLLALLTSTALAEEGPAPGWIGIELARRPTGETVVKRVVEGAPGERAGLHVGDELVEVEGAAVRSPDDVTGRIRGRRVGERVRLRVGGVGGRPPHDVVLVLARRPDPASLQRGALLGKPAPDFALTPVDGARKGRLSSLRGRVVLLDFFATWCLPCMEALPHLDALERELGRAGLSVLGVSAEPAATVATVRGRVGYPLLADADEASGQYQVSALPTLVVIDRAGVVREVALGDTALAERTVRALLGKR